MMVHGFTVLEMQKQVDPRDLLAGQSNLLDEIQANIHTYMQRWGRQKCGSVKREGNVKKGQQSEGRRPHAPRQQRGHPRSTGAYPEYGSMGSMQPRVGSWTREARAGILDCIQFLPRVHVKLCTSAPPFLNT